MEEGREGGKRVGRGWRGRGEDGGDRGRERDGERQRKRGRRVR